MGATKYVGAMSACDTHGPVATEVVAPMAVYQSTIAPPRTAPPEDAQRAFLAHFPDNEKSWITNVFLAAVRSGANTVDAVYTSVEVSLRERLRHAAKRRDKIDHEKTDHAVYNFEHYPEEACDFAEWALAWERLTPAEKAERKAENAKPHIRAYHEGQPPTDRQVAYCRSLGHTGPITSKAHASAIIETLKGGAR